ncbi:MAG TPA: dynamin family protein [Ktedonobacteraceae bacterium]|nr:dynamin family protein [Ktedonobacteraceae bacterium]
MHFIKQKQQVTTCPQCDNVVRIDAEVCNICGKQLKNSTGKTATLAQRTPAPAAVPPAPPIPAPPVTAPIPTPPPPQAAEEEYEDDDEDLPQSPSPVLPSAPGEILHQIHYLQSLSPSMERYFPADLPEKAQKLALWRRQLQRALSCAEMLDREPLQQLDPQRMFKLRNHLSDATRALDFTHEYTVKLVGHAGAGKSTLLAALIGRDIFPRLAGGAVTGVRTRIRLCAEQEPEELHVHFLTRTAFEDLLHQTQQAIQNTQNPRTREALAAELAILLKASETFAAQYLKDDEGYIEIIPAERWENESSRYIEEPARDSEEPRLIRLIDYVEYTIRATPQTLLPPGSALIDLPGGSAGQLRHDALLREELNEVDAVILVIGNNRFGDDDRTQRIFELVKRKVIANRASDVAANMLFLAVTHWDELNTSASVEKALGSLRALQRDLPTGYNSYHHHGPNHDFFFYPLRGLDAMLATLGTSGQQLAENRLQEGREYAGRILSIYPELLKLDATLPATANAQEFQKVSEKQHAAMLHFSGLPEMASDIQTFLTRSRYEVQLRQAETQLAMAFQLLEDLCWEHLNMLGIHSRDNLELDQELQSRKNKRGAVRFEQLQKRTNEMHIAWADALRQFDEAISSEENAFHRALATAHERALKRIKVHIMQGHFDHYIKVSSRADLNSPAMDIGHRWIDIDGWGLIKELRMSFSSALEREINEPARSLAEAFLLPIAYKEEIDATLDITRIALGEFGGEMDDIQKSYSKLKRSIREKARDVCLYVSVGELLNEEKYAPSKDNPAVSALYRLSALQNRPEDVIQQARLLMSPILEVICGDLARSTERRMAHLFRYELDKLEARQIYENDRMETLPTRVPGQFSDLVNRLHNLLTERVITSEALRQQLDQLQAQREATVDGWVELLHDTELLRTVHR